MLLEQLPPGCALARSVNGEKAAWSTTDHLVASVVDELRAYRYEESARNARKGRKPKKPQFVSRPGVVRPDDPTKFGDAKKTPAEMRVLLDRWAGR